MVTIQSLQTITEKLYTFYRLVSKKTQRLNNLRQNGWNNIQQWGQTDVAQGHCRCRHLIDDIWLCIRVSTLTMLHIILFPWYSKVMVKHHTTYVLGIPIGITLVEKFTKIVSVRKTPLVTTWHCLLEGGLNSFDTILASNNWTIGQKNTHLATTL